MKPQLRKWHEDFSEKGLVVIDVNPKDSMDALKAEVEKEELKFPVLHDEGGANNKAYGVSAYPMAVLLAPRKNEESGKMELRVIWEGFPNMDVEAITGMIEEETAKLAENKK